MNNESNSEQSCNINECESSQELELIESLAETSEKAPNEGSVEKSSTESSSEEASAEVIVKPSAQVLALKETLQALPVQERIEGYLQFMKAQLNPQAPNFRDFWESRKDCAVCFRELEDVHTKNMLLDQLQNLCAEAKGLKVMLDEQSQFAMEQISLAIDGIEKEIDIIQEQNPGWKPSHTPDKGQFDQEFYALRQGLLNWLNGFSTRVSGLRKELMKTDMRVRHKNKLFANLSKVGDKIFPPRKELIREVSEHFVVDVERYAGLLLNATNVHIISAKEDVKNWQSLAKELTLNTHAFKKSRELLSQCWEHLKKLDKQLHSQRQSEKGEKRARFQMFIDQIEEIKKLQAAGQLQERMLLSRLDDLSRKARKEDILKEDQETLRQAILAFKQPILDRQDQERAVQVQRRDEIQRLHTTAFQASLEKMKQLLDDASESAYDEMRQEFNAINERITLTHEEHQMLQKMMSQVADRTLDRRVERLIEESKTSSDLKSLYEDLYGCRSELRALLETHKKEAGASGLSFERAMALGERTARERQRIERLEAVIIEIQDKLN